MNIFKRTFLNQGDEFNELVWFAINTIFNIALNFLNVKVLMFRGILFQFIKILEV